MSKKKNKIMLVTCVVGMVVVGIVLALTAGPERGEEAPDTNDGGNQVVDANPETDSETTNDGDPYVDEREALSDDEITMLLDETMQLAYEGQWLEIVDLVEPYETDYNLEDTEASQLLRDYYLDANRLVSLTAMGDSADAVDASVEDLPQLNTEEFFVLGLYYLPRNVLLELSVDQLALAPTQRGYVELIKRTDLPFTLEDGSPNDEVDTHETVGRYLQMIRENEFEEGFVRFDVVNGSIEEYVYVIHQADGSFGLVGFYSDDPSPANTTETVNHHLNFRDDVSKGIEALLNEAQDEYDSTLEEDEDVEVETDDDTSPEESTDGNAEENDD